MWHRQTSLVTRPARGDWGFLETSIARYGETRVRLLLLPPDTTDQQRRMWRLMRAWPLIGLVIGGAATLATADVVGPAAAFVLGVVVWLGPALSLWIALSGFVSRIHERWITCALGCEDSDAERAELERMARALAAAEGDWRHETASRGTFDETWARAYAALAPRVAA